MGINLVSSETNVAGQLLIKENQDHMEVSNKFTSQLPGSRGVHGFFHNSTAGPRSPLADIWLKTGGG